MSNELHFSLLPFSPWLSDSASRVSAQAQKSKSGNFKMTPTPTSDAMVEAKTGNDGSARMTYAAVVRESMDNGGETRPASVRIDTNTPETASSGVMVGGGLMTPSRDIMENAAVSNVHTTLVAALRNAGLVETLKGDGPFTVFAPTNAAFAKLPGGAINKLLRADMKPQLTKVLTYHVVPGTYRAADLRNDQQLTTVEGETLTVIRQSDQVMLRDAKGGTATISIADVESSNGVTHVVDSVLMPGN